RISRSAPRGFVSKIYCNYFLRQIFCEKIPRKGAGCCEDCVQKFLQKIFPNMLSNMLNVRFPFGPAALHGAVPQPYTAELWRTAVPRADLRAATARAARRCKAVHVADLRATQAYLDGFRLTVPRLRRAASGP